MLQNRHDREKINKLLKEVLIHARSTKGYSTGAAADFLDLTESELSVVEENPVIVSSMLLQSIMRKYGHLHELLDAINAATAIIIQNKMRQDREDIPPTKL